MFDRVLIPLDGAPTAEAVIGRLPEILGGRDAEIILLHVMNLPPAVDGYSAGLVPTIRADSDKYLARMRKKLNKEGWSRVDVELAEGTPTDVISRVARRRNADLIAMTTHGRSGPPRWVFGSVAESTMKHSIVPVLVERFGADSTPSSEGEILVPFDGTDAAVRAALLAGAMALESSRGVRLLHAWETLSMPYSQDDARRRLRSTGESLVKSGVRVTTELPSGDASRMILRESGRNVSLVVMSRKGRTGLISFLFGGIRERVTRKCPVPVLVLPLSWEPRAIAGKAIV